METQNEGKKKILFVMVEVGSGHKVPALAVKEAIERLYPGEYETDIVDFAQAAHAYKSDKNLKAFWDFSLAHPVLTQISYKILEKIPRFLVRAYIKMYYRELFKKGKEFLISANPDMVFSTYFFCTSVAVYAQQKAQTPAIVVNHNTDPFDGHILWAEKRAQYHTVSSERSKKRLISHGVPEENIYVLPFPIHRNFVKITKNKQTIMEEYNINPERYTILASAGGQGIGKVNDYIKKIYQKSMPFNVLFICGKNKKIKNEMEELVFRTSSDTNLVPLGYINNMNELLSISDCALIKAGASATFEALIMKTPILFTDWVSYNEKPNIDFVCQQNLGWFAKNEKEFFSIIESIRKTTILDEFKKNIEQFHIHNGVDEIASFLSHVLRGGKSA